MTRVGCLAQCGHNNDSRCSLSEIDIEFNDEGELICLMQDFGTDFLEKIVKMKLYKVVFDISHQGEASAGILPFTDQVTIIVDSGDPGGETEGKYSFAETMCQVLREWYDGAEVDIHE